MGLVLDAHRNVLVADAGNRRIRLIPAVNERWDGQPQSGFDPKVYRIAFVSNSFAYYNCMWDDSIAGIIEQRLNADHALLGLSKPVIVEALPLGNSLVGHSRYLASVLAQGSVDLVIWSLNTNMFADHFDVWPFIDPDFSHRNARIWGNVIQEGYKSLRHAGIPVLLTDSLMGHHASMAEVTRWRDFPRGDVPMTVHPEWRFMERRPNVGYEANVAMEHFLAKSGVNDYLPTYRRFLDYERGTHLPLSSSYNVHFAPSGNAFYARLIVEHLEQVRPWARTR
jgi:hypothetical protein